MHTRISFDPLIKLNTSIPLEPTLNDFDGRLQPMRRLAKATAETKIVRPLHPWQKGLTSREISAGFLFSTKHIDVST